MMLDSDCMRQPLFGPFIEFAWKLEQHEFDGAKDEVSCSVLTCILPMPLAPFIFISIYCCLRGYLMLVK